MAATYSVLYQYPTVEFLGGTMTRDVMSVGYQTKPHGVVFEVRIPKNDYTAAQVASMGIGYSGEIESVFTHPGVTDATWAQVSNAGGFLIDEIVLTVESSSGNSSATLVVPFAEMAPETLAPKVAALRETLDDAEAL